MSTLLLLKSNFDPSARIISNMSTLYTYSLRLILRNLFIKISLNIFEFLVKYFNVEICGR